MPTLSRFTNQNLPDYFAHQIRDFIRIHWFDVFQFDVHAPAMPDEWQPVYFVLAEEQALFSHAAVIAQTVECNEQRYSCAGLSSVLTYPAFRNRGYGGQVVQAATDYLATRAFDVALLWTDADKASIYQRCGWEHLPTLRVFAGDRDKPELYDAFTMHRILSDRAKRNRTDLENFPIYIGEDGW